MVRVMGVGSRLVRLAGMGYSGDCLGPHHSHRLDVEAGASKLAEHVVPCSVV